MVKEAIFILRFQNEGMSVWDKYKRYVEQACLGTDTSHWSAVDFWRNKLFARAISFIIPLSLIALIPGIYIAFITDNQGLIIFDVIIIAGLITLAHLPNIPIQWRKIGFTFLVYSVGIMLLFLLGNAGPGLVYLFAITIFMIIIFPSKYSFLSTFINTAICLIFGLLLHYELVVYSTGPGTERIGFEAWVAISSNLIFLGAVFSFLFPHLFEGMKSSFEKQEELTKDLKQQQAQLKESLQDLENKNKELEQFAYVASHDLQEPLRMVSSFMGLVRDKYNDQLDSKGKQYIHFAIDGASRMQQIIIDLLEYSRAGRVDEEKEICSIDEMLSEVREELHPKITELTGMVHWKSMPDVMAYRTHLKRLFLNLINNGLVYHQKGQKPIVQLSYEETETHWQFCVQDDGLGIDPINFDKIFVIFKRLHRKEDFAGTGIGLAICKKIAELHGGRIWVESTVGYGSKFYFTIKK